MYHKSFLLNGIRVVSHEMQDRNSVSLGFLAGVGGRYETDANKGVAHYLEHVLFKGSKKYSCQEIKSQIEGIGGTLNAFTSEEMTCIYAKVPAKHFVRAYNVLADMFLNPLIQKRDVEKERGVILEEIKMYHDLPQYLVGDLLDGLLWPDHPLGKNLAGTFESVSRMSAADIRRFHRKFYSAPRIVVSACGKVSHAKLVRLAKASFRQLASRTKEPFVRADMAQTSPRIEFFVKDTEQMHIALGVPSLDSTHPERYILHLLNVILGGNMSSRLFNEVREKRGLAYSIGTTFKLFQDSGAFIVRAGVENKKLVEAIEVIVRELRKISKTGPKEREFLAARDYYLGQIQLALEDTLDYMLWLGESFVIKDSLHTLKQIVRTVKKIEPAEVQRLAGKLFNDGNFNLAVVGPLGEKQRKGAATAIGL